MRVLSNVSVMMLHGLGAHGGVWTPMIEAAKDHAFFGDATAQNLIGHGPAPLSESYSLDDYAQAAADIYKPLVDGRWPLVVLGHSMGGAVGLALASGRFGVTPRLVLALGVKVVWTPEEVAWLAKLAASPAKVFDSREAAVDRFLKASGLTGLVAPDSEIAAQGVTETEGGWRLAADPRTAEVGPPPMDELIADAQCPIRLAAGEHDPMSRLEDLRRWDPDAVILPGLGHNAMVENPAAVWAWVRTECGLG